MAVAVVIVVPPVPPSNIDHPHANHAYEEQSLLDGALEAVESIFQSTDRNRLFVVTVVMDGRGKIGRFESKLNDIDAGRTAHRHGDEVHTHDDHHKKRRGGHYWEVEDPHEYEEDAKKKGLKKNANNKLFSLSWLYLGVYETELK